MNLIRKILFPVVPIYYVITRLRNVLYDLEIKKSVSYDFPVICVGNLSVGGTGKTPMIAYLIDLLKNNYKLATLSRGYGRHTKGFVLADEHATARSIGDEPYQFYNAHKNDVIVAVDENRNHGIQNLRTFDDAPEVVLLDDAFQHRKVKAGLNILLTTYNNLYSKDFVLPTGNLREPAGGARRAHIIIVTKCPGTISVKDKKRIGESIKPEEHQHLFFSSIVYSNEVISENNTKRVDDLSDFTLVTGIANPKPLIDFFSDKRLKFEHLNFKDHYEFTQQDILHLNEKTCIITTEKDFMRLKQYDTLKDKLYYIPISISISDASDAEKLHGLVTNFVKS